VNAVLELIRAKQAGRTIEPRWFEQPAKVINPLEALKRSIEAEKAATRRIAARHAHDCWHGPSGVATPMSIPFICRIATTQDAAASPSVAVSAAALVLVMAAVPDAGA